MHSSISEHVGCFCVLTVVNSCCSEHCSAYITLNRVFLQIYCLGVGLQGHMVVPVLVFYGTSILFTTVAVSNYIPTNSVRGLPFLHTLSSLGYWLTF